MSGQIVVTSSNDQTRLFYVYHYFKKIEVTQNKIINQ